MELERTVKQIAMCIFNNWCEQGMPTPYPLTSRDAPEDNIIGDYCKKCSFVQWATTQIIKN